MTNPMRTKTAEDIKEYLANNCMFNIRFVDDDKAIKYIGYDHTTNKHRYLVALGGDAFNRVIVVQVCHADEITLAVIDSLNMTEVAYTHWSGNNTTNEEYQLRLLKEFADKLGYRLAKVKGK